VLHETLSVVLGQKLKPEAQQPGAAEAGPPETLGTILPSSSAQGASALAPSSTLACQGLQAVQSSAYWLPFPIPAIYRSFYSSLQKSVSHY